MKRKSILMSAIKEKEIQKEEQNEKNKSESEIIQPYKTIRQQVITFYTTDNNITKDSVLTQIAVLLAKKSEQKILVIDMNTPTPNLDHFFGVNKEILLKDIYNENRIDTGISACYSAIEKNIFSPELLKEFIIPYSKNKNINILTGVYDLDLCDKLDVKHYERIIEVASEIYDTVLISVNPFWENTATYTGIMKANRVIVTCDANWTNARNTLTVIKNEYINNQRLPKEKVALLITNFTDNSLDKDVLNKLFKEFSILGYVPYNKGYEACLNNKRPFITSQYAKKDVIEYMNIISKLGYIPKLHLSDKLFRQKNIIGSVVKDN